MGKKSYQVEVDASGVPIFTDMQTGDRAVANGEWTVGLSDPERKGRGRKMLNALTKAFKLRTHPDGIGFNGDGGAVGYDLREKSAPAEPKRMSDEDWAKIQRHEPVI